MQMETLFPLPPADAAASAAVLGRRGRNGGSPQSKGTTAESKKVTDETRGFSPHAPLSSTRWSYCTPRGRGRAEQDAIRTAIMGGFLCGGSEIFIKQRAGWFPRWLPVDRSPITYK